MRASDILSRARRPVTPMAMPMYAPMPAPMPAQAPPIVARSEAQQVTVRPPQIPPMAPQPRTGVYQQLMKKHDRMTTRHVHK